MSAAAVDYDLLIAATMSVQDRLMPHATENDGEIDATEALRPLLDHYGITEEGFFEYMRGMVGGLRELGVTNYKMMSILLSKFALGFFTGIELQRQTHMLDHPEEADFLKG